MRRCLCLCLIGWWTAAQSDLLTKTQFEITRLGLKLAPAQQTVLLGYAETPLSFRLTYDGPLQAEMRFKASLIGPGLTASVQVDVPAVDGRIDIDRTLITEVGSYQLADVRLVNAADQVIEFSEPRNAQIEVIDEVFVTRVEVRELTREELLDLGYIFNEDDFNSVSFTLNLVIGSKEETVTANVVYPNVPDDRFQPVVVSDPFKPYVRAIPMDFFRYQSDDPWEDFEPEPRAFRGNGILIIPGNFNYLKSHFGVTAVILNRGPDGYDVRLEHLKTQLSLPPATLYGEPLTTHQPLTQPMVNLGPDGERGTADDRDFALPGEEASSEYVLIGQTEGMYDVRVDISGDVALSNETVPLQSSALARVFVRSPNFSVTFEHPDAVAENEPYDLFMHVRNTSEAVLSGFSVTLDPFRMVGVQLDTGTNPIQSLPDLQPGEEGSLTYRLRSTVAGKVLASYLKIDGAPSGQVDLYVGVGESGEVITPYVFHYPPEFDVFSADLRADLRRSAKKAMDFSQMTADTLPIDLLPITPVAVRSLNEQMVRAAQLEQFQAPHAESLINLFGTWLHSVQGYEPLDRLRRKLIAENSVDPRPAFAAEFTTTLGASTPAQLVQQIARELGDLDGQVGLVFSSNQAGVNVQATDLQGRKLGVGVPDGIPFGTALDLGAAGQSRQLIWISAAEVTPVFQVTGPDGASIDLAVVFPGPQSAVTGSLTQFTLQGPLSLGLNPDTANLVLAPSDQPALQVAAVALSPKPFGLRNVVQLDPTRARSADGFGRHVMFPFVSRIDLSSLDPIESHIWINGEPATDAVLQADGRTLFVSARMPLGPYRDVTYRIQGARAVSGETLPVATGLVDTSSWFIGVSVEGRIVDHSGSDLEQAEVMMYLKRSENDALRNTGAFRVLARTQPAEDGTYSFDFVPFLPFSQASGGASRPAQAVRVGVLTEDGRFRIEELWPGGAGQTLRADFAFSHRGSVEGVVYHDGQPAPFAPLFLSHLDDPIQDREATTDAFGHYRIDQVDVGPITVKALVGDTLGLASGYLTLANSPLHLDLFVDTPRGTLLGNIRHQSDGQSLPVPNAYVTFARYGDVLSEFSVGGLSFQASAVTATQADGNYRLDNVPAGFGQLTIISRDFGIKQVEITIHDDQVTNFDWTFPEDGELQYGGIARGRVLVDGFGVQDAWVTGAGRRIQTDSLGHFELGDLPLDARFPLNVYLPGSSNPDAQIDLLIPESSPLVENLDFSFDGPVTISGVLLDQFGDPIAFEPIFSPPYVNRVTAVAETNAQGEWSFPAHRRGLVNLTAMRIPRTVDGQVFVQDDDIFGFTLQERPASAMRVQLFDPNGDPILGKVRVKSLRASTLFDTYGKEIYVLTHDLLSDAQGVIEFPDLNAGPFEVWGTNPLYGDTPIISGVLTQRDPSDPLVIPLSFQSATLANLFGTVFDSQGLPAGGDIHVEAKFQGIRAPIRTTPSGDFRYESLVNTLDPTRVELLVYDPVNNRYDVANITLRQSLNHRQDFFLKNRRGVVVRVEDHEGQAVDFAAVQIEYDNLYYTPPADPSDPTSFGEADLRRLREVEQITTAVPSVRFADVPIGEFTVRASSGNGLAALRSFVLPDEPGDYEVVVRLEAASRIFGHFLDHIELPIGDAEIELQQGGRLLEQQLTQDATGDLGMFDFSELPMRSYVLEGLDPTSGFTGHSSVTTSAFHPEVEADVRLDPLAHLTGIVRYQGSPVVGAQVTLAGLSSPLTTGTDADGRYLFRNLPLRHYSLRASKIGIPSTVAQTAVALTEHDLLVQLDLTFIDTKDVDILVLDPDGLPAPGILVSLVATVGGITFGDASLTDESGLAHIRDVPPGRYRLLAESPSSFADATATLTVSSLDPSPVTTTLQFAGTGSVSGTVLLSSGQPPQDLVVVSVQHHGPSGRWTTLANIPSDALGAFAMPGLNVGETYRFSVADPASRQSDARNVTLTAHGEHQIIQLTLAETTYITGLVRKADGSPASHVEVRLNEPFLDIVQTDGLGEFFIEPVPAGPFELQAQDPFSPRAAIHQGEILVDAGNLPIPGYVELDLAGLATIQGQVRLGDGTPVTFGEVRIESPSTGPLTTIILADGSYLFSAAPLESYQLVAYDGERIAESAVQQLVVDQDGAAFTADVDFPVSYAVTGHLFTPPTILAAGGTVELWKRPAGSLQYVLAYQATTDANGAFGLDHVYPGPYRLRANNANLSALSDYPVTVPPQNWMHDVFLTERAAVVGSVRDGSARPFTSGTVLVEQFGQTQSVPIQADGTFTVDNLVPGNAVFSASLAAGWFNVQAAPTLTSGVNSVVLDTGPTVDVSGQAIVVAQGAQIPQVIFTFNNRTRSVSLNASGDFVLDRAPANASLSVKLSKQSYRRTIPFNTGSADLDLGQIYLDTTAPAVSFADAGQTVSLVPYTMTFALDESDPQSATDPSTVGIWVNGVDLTAAFAINGSQATATFPFFPESFQQGANQVRLEVRNTSNALANETFNFDVQPQNFAVVADLTQNGAPVTGQAALQGSAFVDSDSQGRVVFSGLTAATVPLKARSGDSGSRAWVNVGAAPTSFVTLDLVPVGTYTGSVLAADGGAAANATVWINGFSETSDAVGVYAFDLLPLGAHAVVAESGPEIGFSNGPEIALAGQLRIDVDVQLAATGQVEGVVYDDDGISPIPQAEVTLTVPGYPPWFDRTATADASGAYQIDRVAAQAVELTAVEPATQRLGMAQAVVLAEQVVQVDIQMEPARDLFGVLQDSQGSALTHWDISVSGPRNVTVQTDAGGAFLFENLPMNATYQLIAERQTDFEYLELEIALGDQHLDLGVVAMTLDQPPVINALTLTNPLDPVANVVMSADVNDDRRLASWDLVFTDAGQSVGHAYGGLNTDHWVQQRVVDVNNGVTAPQIEYVFTVTDHWGQTTVASGTLDVIIDSEAPLVAITAPAQGVSYFAGERITVLVDATDNLEVERVEMTLQSAPPIELSDLTTPYRFQFDAPFVAQTTSIPLVVTASDPRGNSNSHSIDLSIQPLTTSGSPEVTLLAPMADQPLPISLSQGLQLQVAALASDPDGLWNYSVLVNDLEVLTDFLNGTQDLVEASYTLPPELRQETSLDVALVVRDTGGQSTRHDVTVHQLDGIALEALTLGPVDLQYENQSLILVGGNHLIDGTHAFADLALVNGATLTQTATRDVAPEVVRTDLQVTGNLVVDYGSAINLDGKGYGAMPPELGLTGASSHAGLAFDSSDFNEIYGSPFQPHRPGSYRGGGCLYAVADQQWILGDISADGLAHSGNQYGSGGSIWLQANQFHGRGTVGANGYPNLIQQGNNGGSGGRIAIYGTFEGTLEAYGGRHGNNPAGGAGTIYRRVADSSQSDGFLDTVLIQNHTSHADSQATRLAQLGPYAFEVDITSRMESQGADEIQVLTVLGGLTYLDLAGFTVTSSSDPAGLAIDHTAGNELWLIPNQTLTLNPGDVIRIAAQFDAVTLSQRAVLDSSNQSFVSTLLTVDGGTLAGEQGPADFTTIEPVLTDAVWIRGQAQFNDLTTHADLAMQITGDLQADLFDHAAGTLILDGSIQASTIQSAAGTLIQTPSQKWQAAMRLDATDLVLLGDMSARDNGFQLRAPDPMASAHGGVGLDATSTQCYGSLYDPQSEGNGYNYGSGIIQINAQQSLTLDGDLDVTGLLHSSGGTVNIYAQTMSGTGSIKANGCSACAAGGGGGRIALIVNDPTSFSGVLEARAQSGGGAGTIFTQSDQWPLGKLVLDNGGISGLSSGRPKARETVLPGLGIRTAASATGGSEVLGADFPDSLTGLHLVVDGFAPVRIDSNTADRLLPETSFPVLSAGAFYSGLHRLNVLEIRGNAHLVSLDPIEVTSQLIMESGALTVPDLDYPAGFSFTNGSIILDGPLGTDDLVLDNFQLTLAYPATVNSIQVTNGSTLVYRQPLTASQLTVDASTLQAEVTNPTLGLMAGDVTLQNAASWIVSDRADTNADPYPIRAQLSGTLTLDASSTISSGGSNKVIRQYFQWPQGIRYNPAGQGDLAHGGLGRINNGTDAKVFGSFVVPNRFGSYNGGGLIDLEAGHLQIEGVIQANGVTNGSGGSIVLQGTSLAGSGSVEAMPASFRYGGGRIAVHYDSDSSFRDSINFHTAHPTITSAQADLGGAGTLFFKSNAQVYGELVIDQRIGAASTSNDGDWFSARARLTAIPGFNQLELFNDTTPGDQRTVTDASWELPPDLQGLVLRIPALAFEAVVESNTYTSITMDRDLPKPLASGTTFQLVLVLDRLVLRNGAQLFFPGTVQTADLQSEGTHLNSLWAHDLVGLSDTLTFQDTQLRLNLDEPSWQAKQLTVTNSDLYFDQPIALDQLNLVNSRLRHSWWIHSMALAQPRLDLTVNSLTLDAASTIDVAERASGYDHNGIRNSHGGVGTTTEATYGSLFRPVDYGSSNNGTSENGGGAVRLQVGTLSDATFTAAGERGAGGSIWIDAGHITGDLNLNASVSSSFTRGGGGRIAVTYDQLDGSLSVDARGLRSAGTIYQRNRSAQPYGSLTIQDMTGTDQAPTQLPGFPPATLPAGFTQSYDGPSDSSTLSIPNLTLTEDYVGHYLFFQNDEALRYLVTAQAQQGTDALFTLGGSAPALNVGDAYQLAVVLDALDFCATCSMGTENVRLIVVDQVAPTIDSVIVTPLVGGVLDSDQLFDVTITGSDNQALDRAEVSWNGQNHVLPGGSPYVVQLQAPAVATPSDLTLNVVLFDTGNLASDPAVQVLTVVEPDLQDPVAAIAAPADGSIFNPDTAFTLTASASDNRLVASIQVDFDGANQTYVYPEGTWGQPVDFEMTSPSGGGTYPLLVTATDLAGNSGQTSIDIQVDAADVDGPTINLVLPTVTSTREGEVLTIEVQLTDASGIQSAQATLRGTVAPLSESGGAWLGNLPVNAPTGLMEAATLTIQATDTQNNSRQLDVPMQVIGANYAQPSLAIHQPLTGAMVESHQTATLAVETRLLFEDAESGENGWSHAATNPTYDWRIDGSDPHSGATSWRVPDRASNVASLYSTYFTPTSGSQLVFWNRMWFTTGADGGQLFVDTYSGKRALTLVTDFVSGGYNGTITQSSNPLNGQLAWTGNLAYQPVLVDLSPWQGQAIRLVWRYAGNNVTQTRYWTVDDVRVSHLGGPSSFTQYQLDVDGNLADLPRDQAYQSINVPEVPIPTAQTWTVRATTPQGIPLQANTQVDVSPDASDPEITLTTPADYDVLGFASALHLAPTINDPSRSDIGLRFDPPFAYVDLRTAGTSNVNLSNANALVDIFDLDFDGSVVVAAMNIPPYAAELRFENEFTLSSAAVGAIVEISIDGSNWTDLAANVVGGYGGTFDSTSVAGWENRPCLTAQTPSSVRVDLTSYAGQSAYLRWTVRKFGPDITSWSLHSVHLTGIWDLGEDRIAQVDFAFDGATQPVLSAPFSADFTVPSPAGTETRDITLTATDLSGNSTQLTRPVFIGGTQSQSLASAQVGEGDSTYDGLHLILQAGNHRIDGVHNFASLVMAAGAVLTHSPTLDGNDPTGMDLTVTGAFFLAENAEIDLDGLGYPQDTTHPALGLAAGHGHAGWGQAELQGAYGSVSDPYTVGSASGGGRLRIQADTLTVVGSIHADGVSYNGQYGSGGSVNLRATTALSGSGPVSANGFSGSRSAALGGGGGRIAMVSNGAWDYSGTATSLGGVESGAGTIYRYDGAGHLDILGADVVETRNATPLNDLDVTPVEIRVEHARATEMGPLLGTQFIITDGEGGFDPAQTVDLRGRLTHTDARLSGDLTLDGDIVDPSSRYRGSLELVGTIRTGSLDVSSVNGHSQIGFVGTWIAPSLTFAEIQIHAMDDQPNQPMHFQVTGHLDLSYGVNLRANNGSGVDGNRYSHGGYGYQAHDDYSTTQEVPGHAPYGSFYEPDTPGGVGGVIRIEADQLTLEGNLYADGQNRFDRGGSGGSVFIHVNQIDGWGSIYAQGTAEQNVGNLVEVGGSGGRIALIVDQPGGDQFNGQMRATGAAMYPWNEMYAAPGTVYRVNDAFPQGHLIVDGDWGLTLDHARTVLPSLAVVTVGTDDLDGDNLLVDPTQSFPPQLAGRLLVHNADPLVRISDNDATSLTGDQPFGIFTTGETYWGRHQVTQLTVNWDLSSADEISYGTLNHQDGVIDVLNFVLPKRRLLSDGEGDWKQSAYQEELVLDGYALNLKTQLWVGSLELRAGSRLVLDPQIPAPQVRAQRLWLRSGSTLTLSPQQGDAPPMVIAVTEDLVIERDALMQLSGLVANPGLPSHGGLAVGAPLASLYDAPVVPHRVGRGLMAGAALKLQAQRVHLDGAIRAQGLGYASGGAVYLNAGELTGQGSIDVSGGRVGDLVAGGGRIALHLSQWHRYAGQLHSGELAPGSVVLARHGDSAVELYANYHGGCARQATQPLALLPAIVITRDAIQGIFENTSGSLIQVARDERYLDLIGMALYDGDQALTVLDVMQPDDQHMWIQLQGPLSRSVQQLNAGLAVTPNSCPGIPGAITINQKEGTP